MRDERCGGLTAERWTRAFQIRHRAEVADAIWPFLLECLFAVDGENRGIHDTYTRPDRVSLPWAGVAIRWHGQGTCRDVSRGAGDFRRGRRGARLQAFAA